MTIVTTEESSRTDVVTIQMSGKLEREDYEKLVPLIEQRLQDHDKVRLLCEMTDFDGFTAGAAWEDIKFDVRHFNDVERVAVVGDTKWQERLNGSLNSRPRRRGSVWVQPPAGAMAVTSAIGGWVVIRPRSVGLGPMLRQEFHRPRVACHSLWLAECQ